MKNRRFLSGVLVLVMFLTLFPTTALADEVESAKVLAQSDTTIVSSNFSFSEVLDEDEETPSFTTALTSGGYVIWNGHRYQFIDSDDIHGGLYWENAEAYCESLGGHLVTITSEEEQELVASLIENGACNGCWIGAKRSESKFAWVTGESWNYTHWGSGQPDNVDNRNECYAMMFRITNPWNDDNVLGDWNDVTESSAGSVFTHDKMGYVCEWDSISGNDSDTLGESWIVGRVRAYTSGEMAGQYLALQQEECESIDSWYQRNLEFFTNYGLLDVKEGIAYLSNTSTERYHYALLTDNACYGAYQYFNWLKTTPKGQAAQAALVADGLLFNSELKTWIDPRTYVGMKDFPGVQKYKDMLYDFMDTVSLEAEKKEYISVIEEMQEYIDEVKDTGDNTTTGAEVYAKSLIAKIDECDSEEALSKVLKSAEAQEIYWDLKSEPTYDGSIEAMNITFELSEENGFGKFAKAMGYATKTISVIDMTVNHVIDFIEFDAKIAAYNQYRDFLDEIATSSDFPAELSWAAYEIYNELDEGIWAEIKSLGLDIVDQFGTTGWLKDAVMESVLTKAGAAAISSWLTALDVDAWFINSIVDIGAMVKNVANVEGYAYLEIHFNQKLQDCEDEFLANPTEENAWEFYDDYVLLYNLRIQGEKALQKLYKGEGIASYFTDFGAGNNLELIDNALTLLEECEFTIDEGVEIPQSVKYASKAVVNCPVNVEVYAPDGTYITTLVDGVESDVTNDYGRFAVVYRPFTGTYAKVICMSQEGDYTFQIQAENDGLVDLELASDKGQEVYEVRNLPVYTQDVISTSVEQVTKEQSYQLTRDGEEVQQGTLTLVTETYRPVSALTLSQDELLLSRGESTLLNVSFDPVDATEQRVQWQSDDPTIATVQDGKVTAQSAGTTTIRCYSMDNNDVIATCQVTVLPSLLGDYADNYTVSVENTADSVVLTLSPKNSEEATLSLADLTAYLAGYTSEGQLVKISSSTGEETQEGGRVFTLLWSEQGDVYRLFLVDQNICPILDCAEIDRNAHHLS